MTLVKAGPRYLSASSRALQSGQTHRYRDYTDSFIPNSSTCARVAFNSLVWLASAKRTCRLSMDFLKSAVASAISKGPSIPYSFGDKVDIDQSIWTLYNGTIRVSLLVVVIDTCSNYLRKIAQHAASSALMSPPTSPDWPLLRTPSGK